LRRRRRSGVHPRRSEARLRWRPGASCVGCEHQHVRQRAHLNRTQEVAVRVVERDQARIGLVFGLDRDGDDAVGHRDAVRTSGRRAVHHADVDRADLGGILGVGNVENVDGLGFGIGDEQPLRLWIVRDDLGRRFTQAGIERRQEG
jgi:hypothetical protein